jgi:hypothetical protein
MNDPTDYVIIGGLCAVSCKNADLTRPPDKCVLNGRYINTLKGLVDSYHSELREIAGDAGVSLSGPADAYDWANFREKLLKAGKTDDLVKAGEKLINESRPILETLKENGVEITFSDPWDVNSPYKVLQCDSFRPGIIGGTEGEW